MLLERGVLTVALKNGEYLHFWYANNKGNGSTNCTIIRSSLSERAACSVKQGGRLSVVYTSSWKGKVNFSKRVQEQLGIAGEGL